MRDLLIAAALSAAIVLVAGCAPPVMTLAPGGDTASATAKPVSKSKAERCAERGGRMGQHLDGSWHCFAK